MVTNNSNVPLSNVGVTDDKGVTVSCPKTTLAVAESMTCTANGTAVAGQYANIGTATGTPPVGDPVTDDDPSHYFGTTSTIDIEKATNGEDADTPTGPNIPVGDAVAWTYVVTNNSNVPLSNVGVTDDQGVTVSCPKTTLAVAESMTCTANGTAVAGQYANMGTATGTPPVGDPVTDDDPSHYFGTGEPSIDIVKEISLTGADGTWVDANDVGSALVGVFPSPAYYRFTVTNNGSAPLKDVEIDDPELGITGVDVYAVGDLAIGQTVVLTSGDISELYVAERCDGRGTFLNTATASGKSSETDEDVSDFDSAYLKCIGEPHVTIVKEISPTGSDPWYDDATPPQEYPSDAWYRITVTNDGTVPLENVEVQDGDLGVLEQIGDLAIGETVVLDAGPLPDKVPELYVEDRCTGPGDVGNSASVTGNSVDDPNDTVDESDTATLVCVGSPMISIKKEISTDNSSWVDANSAGTALVTQAPSDAYYRITVTNTGPVGLTNVVLNDGTLGIVNYNVGDIAAGASVVLTNGQIAALHYPGRCTGRGVFSNVANVQGESSETGSQTSLATDEAWLECTGTPDIQIVKEVSPTGSDPWYDGLTPPQVPPSDAWYRLTVTNTGNSDLENVVVNDVTLGITNWPIGDLLINETVVLTSNEITGLYWQNACTDGGIVPNTASAGGDSVEFPYDSVNDDDGATLSCEDQLNLCEDGKPARVKVQYDGDDDSANSQDPSQITIAPTTVNFPSGDVYIEVYDHKNRTRVFAQTVPKFGSFWVYGPRKLISSSYWFYIYTTGGSLLQTINFHTSCSQPLNVGDEFGGITVLGGL